ncbi:MAG TPA: glycosyltransferase family 1 protein [Pyrinomonadaceae bacterium]|nr:glycosyltransferase family 1 protein [Pyrinomonadaceae bacterium]
MKQRISSAQALSSVFVDFTCPRGTVIVIVLVSIKPNRKRFLLLMRIGIDGIPLATPKSGIGHYTFELARGVAQLAPDDDFELIAPVSLELEADGAIPSNLRAIHSPVNALRRRWWTIGLPLYVRQTRLGLFHGTNYNVPLWQRCPTVVTIHDLSLLLHSETHREDLVRRARKRFPTMTRIANRIITDSESVKREIAEHLNVEASRITAVPLAARRAFHPRSPDKSSATRHKLGVEDDFILFVGTVEPRKNLLTLVRAFDQLISTTQVRPQLVIAGQKGWLSEELYAFVEKSTLKDRILFTNYVTDEDLSALYSSCRVCVYPSLYEGFGLPPLEAMACGAPVITSRIPVIMETTADAAMLITPTDVRDLTAALAKMFDDPNTRAHYAESGLKRSSEFTWEKTARKTLEVYREALSDVKAESQVSIN